MKRSVLLLAAGLSLNALAHDTAPPNGCDRPARPSNEQDVDGWNAFVAQVDDYRACISKYIDENFAASDRHREAANLATQQWNDFVRAELNVPEDYPWPPKERR